MYIEANGTQCHKTRLADNAGDADWGFGGDSCEPNRCTCPNSQRHRDSETGISASDWRSCWDIQFSAILIWHWISGGGQARGSRDPWRLHLKPGRLHRPSPGGWRGKRRQGAVRLGRKTSPCPYSRWRKHYYIPDRNLRCKPHPPGRDKKRRRCGPDVPAGDRRRSNLFDAQASRTYHVACSPRQWFVCKAHGPSRGSISGRRI